MSSTPQPPLRTIFPESSRAKRLAVRALRWYAKTLPKPPPFPPPGDAPVRILIHSMGGIGNTLMATPLIAATRKLYPNARIDLLTTPGAAELLKTDPNLNEVLVDQQVKRGYFELPRRIGRTKYHLSISTLNAHLIKSSARLVLARIPIRVMHQYQFRSFDDFSSCFTHVVPRSPLEHDTLANIRLLEHISGSSCLAEQMNLTLSESERQAAANNLISCDVDPSAPILALCPGSSGWMSFKRWPFSKCLDFVSLINRSHPDFQVLIYIGPDELEEEAAWLANSNKAKFTIIQGLSVREYASALQMSTVIVSNDSLPMHIASCTKNPVVAVFGPTSSIRTGPWMVPSRVVSAVTDYSPYYEVPYPLDPQQFPDCMNIVTPGMVESAVTELLNEVEITA